MDMVLLHKAPRGWKERERLPECKHSGSNKVYREEAHAPRAYRELPSLMTSVSLIPSMSTSGLGSGHESLEWFEADISDVPPARSSPVTLFSMLHRQT